MSRQIFGDQKRAILKSRFLEISIYYLTLCLTYGYKCRIHREEIQAVSSNSPIKNDRYLRITTRRIRDANAFMRVHEGQFLGLQFPEGFVIESCYHENMLFASRTLLPRKQYIQHNDRCTDQQMTALFTDDYPLSLYTDSRSTFLWREIGFRYLTTSSKIDHHDIRGLTVWVCAKFHC